MQPAHKWWIPWWNYNQLHIEVITHDGDKTNKVYAGEGAIGNECFICVDMDDIWIITATAKFCDQRILYSIIGKAI